MEYISKLHLYPVFALILLTYIVWLVMARRRFAAVRAGQYQAAYFKTFIKPDPYMVLPEKPELAARNFINLFEIPVLFYALIPLLILSQQTDGLTLACSWIFVVTRYMHSFIHTTYNKLFHRMRIYFIGSFILFLMWVRFFIQMLSN